jgi:CPA2 family monovalent cation:H+ antiporter-2
MTHNLDLIVTLAGGLSAALALGLVTHKLRLSPIVGYLLAGIMVGPFTPGFVAHGQIAEQLAEVGVILLMFGVGLHLHLKELLAVRAVALPGALVQIAVSAVLGVLLAHFAGWPLLAGLVFGLAISVASTVVLLRMLSDQGLLHTRTGHIAVGWLIVEDIFTVFALVLLPALIDNGSESRVALIARGVGEAILKVSGLVAFTLLVGQRVIPRLLTSVAKTRSRELFTLAVLAIALGISVGAAKVFGVSMALGAFLAGIVVGQSEFSSRAASDALPMRDAFAVLFFVSMGMLFDPSRLLADVWLTLGTLAVVLVAKPLAAMLMVSLLRHPLSTGLTIGVALAQIGEFSFILAALGRQLEILPEAATQVLVVASIVSITLNPLLFRAVAPISRWFGARASGAQREPRIEISDDAQRTIVIGYGPVGRTLTRLLREQKLGPVVIELNYETVKQLESEGIPAVFGDASREEILQAAGIANARSLIFTASGTPPPAVILAAKALNPSLLVLARADYLQEAGALRDAGAHVVITAEAEVALAMAERLLMTLGATPDQLDRERDRVRSALTPGAGTDD